MLNEPIDAEHKKYVLMSAYKKYEDDIENMYLYPSFPEVALHFAISSTLLKDNRLYKLRVAFEDLSHHLSASDLVTQPFDSTLTVNDEFVEYVSDARKNFFNYFQVFDCLWRKINMESSFIFDLNDEKHSFYKWDVVVKTPEETRYYFVSLKLTKNKNKPYKVIAKELSGEQDFDGLPRLEFVTQHHYDIERTLFPILERKVIQLPPIIREWENYKNDGKSL